MAETKTPEPQQSQSTEAGCPPRRSVEVIYERSLPGHRGYRLPRGAAARWEAAIDALPETLRRKRPPELPEVTEPEVVRHFIGISLLNHHVDRSLYPLGSCTMKYNPKINEELARLPGFALLHPQAPETSLQGILALLWRFERELACVVGMAAVSLHPAAGAQGEMLGMKLFRAYHRHRGHAKRKVLVPDSAHGTNPASVVLSGFEPVQIASGADGRMDLGAIRAAIDDDTAGIMVTNPNTLGLFEKEIAAVAEAIHAVDGLVYMDGANLNALVGLAQPGAMGVDIVHLNLHKTFSTPHGGGGPGSGPVAVTAELEPFLPVPIVERTEAGYRLEHGRPLSVGPLHPWCGNAGVVVRAFAYLHSLGAEGLAAVSRAAIVNANYLMKQVADSFPVAKREWCMHEFISSASWTKKHKVRVMDVAKRLLDFGFHAPTVSFPLIVPDALMIEPTETETRPTLDRFAAALREIAREVRESPERVQQAPHSTCVGRLNEAAAARRLRVRWQAAKERDDAGGA
ncbi:MAG: aminomethyl-transferring glycine dehydrogenase subunit GcvPB [Candidatus Eisenbacteria bacterium]|nr:aminomethyl-transferring glycine dehydrogenase subunit GcvPB [Candidatus Eisenbacteria bacterium]